MDALVMSTIMVIVVAVTWWATTAVKNAEVKKIHIHYSKLMADLIDRQDKRIETLFQDYESTASAMNGKYTEALMVLNEKYSRDATKFAEAHGAAGEAFKMLSDKIGLEEKIVERINFMRGAE